MIDSCGTVHWLLVLRNIQDAMPVSFKSKLFTSYILTIIKQWNILLQIWETAKYMYSYSCMLNYYRKMNLLKICGMQISALFI